MGAGQYCELVDIFKEEKLPEYVDESLIEYLKKKRSPDLYYFTQMGETMQFNKDCRVLVKNVLTMTDDMYVVPVIFKGKDFYNVVIAYVKKSGSEFKIASISDAYPY